jgi:nucleotide-binding universal stress UspA family protein
MRNGALLAQSTNMFRHILVPTDFSEPASRALEFAISLASKFDSKLTLLHASWLPPSAYATAAGIYWPTDELERAAKKELETLMPKVIERCRGAQGIVLMGEPSLTILDVAKERSCDLIVMGTHGRRGLARVFLGSVAEKVVRLSPIPVLIVSDKEAEVAKLGLR